MDTKKKMETYEACEKRENVVKPANSTQMKNIKEKKKQKRKKLKQSIAIAFRT